jgi:hypothetical protein
MNNLPWKLYSPTGAYRASADEAELLAVIVGTLGQGATIRYGHKPRDVGWREGVDGRAVDDFEKVVNECHAAKGRAVQRWNEEGM